jgi:hypothetical protein
MNEGGEKKYSVTLLISKDDQKTIEACKAAIRAAATAGKDKLANSNGVIPKGIKNPLRDGDEDRVGVAGFENCFFINCSTKRQPSVVDAHLQAIINPEDFYSGCYGRASINFYVFNVNGNKGIACGLNNLQKLSDGEPLANGNSAAQDFADVSAADDAFFGKGEQQDDLF